MMSEAFYDTTEGEFVDFATLEEWETIDKSKDARIGDLEAELSEYKHVASAIDNQWAESQDEIADLKAKLEKAVIGIKNVIGILDDPTGGEHAQDMRVATMIARTTLAELTGGKDG